MSCFAMEQWSGDSAVCWHQHQAVNSKESDFRIHSTFRINSEYAHTWVMSVQTDRSLTDKSKGDNFIVCGTWFEVPRVTCTQVTYMNNFNLRVHECLRVCPVTRIDFHFIFIFMWWLTNLVTHQIGQEWWLCSLHNPPSIVIFPMYDTVAYCQL